jgi:hypothetical protein
MAYEERKIIAKVHSPLYRWDVNGVLESEMDTKSYSKETESCLTEIYDLIDAKKYNEANAKIKKFKEEAGDSNHPEMVRADLLVQRGMRNINEKYK